MVYLLFMSPQGGGMEILMAEFVHLHNHTGYSLLDGAVTPKGLVLRAKELGQKAVAITDHGVMFGVMEFYDAAVEAGIKPIIGCEVYVAARSLYDKIYEQDYKRYHLILLAKNNIGYHNLMKIVSVANTDGFYGKPRVDKQLLNKYSEGLICLSACIAGEIPRAILENDLDGARELIKEYITIFGKENFFLEVQNHNIADELKVNQHLVLLAREYDIGLVATNDVHYANKEDTYYHEVLLCIQTAKTVHDDDRLKFEGEEYYIKSSEEMSELFSQIPQAIDNSVKIAEMCNVEIEKGNYHLPKYTLPQGEENAFEYLKKLCFEGIKKRYEVTDSIIKRLNYELSVISDMGFVDYFLIVWDFIKYAKDNNIIVGPGRGSSAGSIVAYALNITEVDPLQYDLLFERFLNPERVSMPDIDIDFCVERRGEVIDYVVNKYGKDKVAQIITFGTMAARAVIRDVGRALDISYAEVDTIAKMVPFNIHQTIDNALATNKALRDYYEANQTARKVLDIGRRLEGLPRHASTHAAGVVITNQEVSNYVPLALSDDAVVTQYTMTTLEQLGLLKMDFLGLRNLTIIGAAVRNVNIKQVFDINKISYNEKKVFDLLSSGNTDGVFQLESTGMKRFMRELKPQSLEDIIAGISLYRPGPMDAIPKYIANKNDPSKIHYAHPLLKPILSVTYGCIVYQEQVMQIVQSLAGYSLGEADELRRAMSKKKASVMEEGRKAFVEGAGKRGVDVKTASSIYDDMADFAKYAFNKSHAAAYAVVAYQTAYLKTFYPVEFLAAVMTSQQGNMPKLVQYISECRKMGIIVLPPDVNESGISFTVSGNEIRFGLAAIKGVGYNVVEEIEKERKNGKFTSLMDFCARLCDKGLNKRMVEAFIHAGAFDSLGGNRMQYLAVYEKYIDEASTELRSNFSGQLSLLNGANEYEDELPNLNDMNSVDKLALEREVLGIYVSGHPLDQYRELLEKNASMYISDIVAKDSEDSSEISDGQRVEIAGIVTKRVNKLTKNDAQMAFVTVEDLTGSVEIIVFPKLLSLYDTILIENALVKISGHVTLKEEEDAKLILDGVTTISKKNDDAMRLYIKVPPGGEGKLGRLEKILGIFEGDIPVFVYILSQKKSLRSKIKITPTKALFKEIKLLFGEESEVVLKNIESTVDN